MNYSAMSDEREEFEPGDDMPVCLRRFELAKLSSIWREAIDQQSMFAFYAEVGVQYLELESYLQWRADPRYLARRTELLEIIREAPWPNKEAG